MRIAPRSAPAPPRRSWLRSAAPPSPSSVGPATPTSRPASATTATIPSPPSSVSASRHQGDYEKTLVRVVPPLSPPHKPGTITRPRAGRGRRHWGGRRDREGESDDAKLVDTACH